MDAFLDLELEVPIFGCRLRSPPASRVPMPSSEDNRVAIHVSSERPFGAPNATPGFVDGSFDPARPHSEREGPPSHHEEANGTKIGRASFDQPFLMEMPHLAAARVRRPYTPPWFPTHRRGFERVSSIAAMAANRLFAYLGAGAINTPARTTFAHDPMSTRFGNALVNIISPRCPTVPPSRPQASPDRSCTITSTTSHASAAAFFVPWRSSVKAPRPPH